MTLTTGDSLSPVKRQGGIMVKTLYNWKQIKIEYESGKALNAIRRDHGCNRATIRKHAAKGGWLRPELVLLDVTTILGKATHEELLESSPAYRTCDEERMKGRNYYKRAHPRIKSLTTENKKLRALLSKHKSRQK